MSKKLRKSKNKPIRWPAVGEFIQTSMGIFHITAIVGIDFTVSRVAWQETQFTWERTFDVTLEGMKNSDVHPPTPDEILSCDYFSSEEWKRKLLRRAKKNPTYKDWLNEQEA